MADSVARCYDGLADAYHLLFADWDASVRRQGEILDRAGGRLPRGRLVPARGDGVLPADPDRAGVRDEGRGTMGQARMQDEQPVLTIRGEKVGLGPIRRDLLHLHVKWANDPEVTVPLGGWAGPSTIEDQEAWYARDSKRDEKRIVYLIYELVTMRPIGCTDLRDVNYRDRTAWFDVFIGEKDCWGKGYATETARLMLRYGFEALGLHCILLQVNADNERAIRAYTRAGFTVTGRHREVIRRPGGRVDSVLMDCLAREFRDERSGGA